MGLSHSTARLDHRIGRKHRSTLDLRSMMLPVDPDTSTAYHSMQSEETG